VLRQVRQQREGLGSERHRPPLDAQAPRDRIDLKSQVAQHAAAGTLARASFTACFGEFSGFIRRIVVRPDASTPTLIRAIYSRRI